MHHNQEHLNPMSTAKDVWVLLYWFFIWNHNKETVKNTAYNSYHTLKKINTLGEGIQNALYSYYQFLTMLVRVHFKLKPRTIFTSLFLLRFPQRSHYVVLLGLLSNRVSVTI